MLELLHPKMYNVLEYNKMIDRWEWIRQTSITGSVFDLDQEVDRSLLDGILQLIHVHVHLN